MDADLDKERIARLWRSVFQPGADLEVHALPKISTPEIFSPGNGLALAWLTQLVYIRETERRTTLAIEAGWLELQSETIDELHWSLFAPREAPGTQVLVFRGTAELTHWIFNVKTLLSAWPTGGKVHTGFAQAFESLEPSLREAFPSAPQSPLCLAGHSLGGALALLAATHFPSQAVYTFGCPRPGNGPFADGVVAKTPVYRVVHDQDIVTTIPYEIEFLNDLAYRHAGRTVHLRPDEPLLLDDDRHLPGTMASWRQALHAILEGDHVGEPLPALQDHAPACYVRTLRQYL